MARGRRLGAAEQSLASRISAGRRGHQCVGVSGLLVNRVCETNRVVGGAAHPCASPGASERIQDWVLGGVAADTDRRSFGTRGSHASRSHQHTAWVAPSEWRDAQQRRAASGGCRAGARGQRQPGGSAWHTGGGDRHRTSEARNQLTTRMCEPEANTYQERSGRDKQRQKSNHKGLTIAAT